MSHIVCCDGAVSSDVTQQVGDSKVALLIVCNVASDYTGNFGSSVAALARAGRRCGWAVTILLPEAARHARSTTAFEEFDLVFSSFVLAKLASTLRALRRRLPRDGRVLAHLNFLGAREAMVVKRYFKNVVFHCHMAPESGGSSMKARLKRAIKRRLFRGMVLVGVSGPVADELSALYPRSVCVSVPNAIDFCRLGLPSRASVKPDAPLLLGVFGNHFLRKGADIAIEAVAIARSSGVPCKLVLYVSDPDVAASDVRRYCREFGLSDDLVAVERTREDVASIYNSLDVFMSPSRSEAFCTAVVEASYCAPQVIASIVPGQDSLRIIPGTIWFDIEGGAPALAGAIEKAWERARSSDLAAIKERQRHYVLEHYSLDEWVGQMLVVFNRLLDE